MTTTHASQISVYYTDRTIHWTQHYRITIIHDVFRSASNARIWDVSSCITSFLYPNTKPSAQ